MRSRLRSAAATFVCLWIALSSFSANAADTVCRERTIRGMEDRTQSIHGWLGPDTTDIHKIRAYITKDGDALYIQSNFRSQMSENPTTFAAYPTKLRVDSKLLGDIEAAFENIIFWAPDGQGPPADAQQKAISALADAEIYVDPGILGADGRPPIDLSMARDIRLATDSHSIESGTIEVLSLKKPPPALIERLAGCCFSGRPPAGRREILQRLAQHPINKNQVGLLSMVIDTGTDRAIADAPVLRAAAARISVRSGDWNTRLSQAMRSSSGRTLIVLSHIEGDKVKVEDAGGQALFEISLDDIHALANANNVQLILFGCETARAARSMDVPVGIIGRYNTVFAAQRISAALDRSSNGAEFLSNVSAEGLRIVAQPGAWSPTGVGAGIFTPPKGHNGIAHRLARLFFMGRI